MNNNNNERHDIMLWQILQEQRTIVGFLDSIFGFLARRTDFYHEMKNENDTLGFPPGVREQLTLRTMKKFDYRQIKDMPVPVPEPPPIQSQLKTIKNIPHYTSEEVLDNTIHIIDDMTKKKNLVNKEDSENMIFNKSDYFNGAQYNNYCWSQTISDFEIFINLPKSIRTSKDVIVKILPHSIKVIDKNLNNIILDGTFAEKCKSNEAVWSINGRKLHIHLDKFREIWLKKCLIAEPEIDVNEIDCSRSIYDLPEQSQIIIEKLKWDQEQKRLGLPTSDDLKNEAILKKAWNAENSPFRGEPFDPSLIKFQ